MRAPLLIKTCVNQAHDQAHSTVEAHTAQHSSAQGTEEEQGTGHLRSNSFSLTFLCRSATPIWENVTHAGRDACSARRLSAR